MKLRRDITYVEVNGKKYASAKSDGASLEMGSSEYRERLRDLKGMDEHEQEKDKLADAGFRPKTEDRFETTERDAYDEGVENLREDMLRADANIGKGRLTDTQRNVSHQIRKSLYVSKIEENAREEAEKTIETDDDEKVRRVLPNVLENDVYNEGVTEDDFYPGSKTLNKYL